jgi:hypothetical protein
MLLRRLPGRAPATDNATSPVQERILIDDREGSRVAADPLQDRSAARRELPVPP